MTEPQPPRRAMPPTIELPPCLTGRWVLFTFQPGFTELMCGVVEHDDLLSQPRTFTVRASNTPTTFRCRWSDIMHILEEVEDGRSDEGLGARDRRSHAGRG